MSHSEFYPAIWEIDGYKNRAHLKNAKRRYIREICCKISVKRLDLTFLWYVSNIVSFIKIYSYLDFSMVS